jgi:hypothetical protein
MDDALSWVVIGSASVLLALVLMLGLKLISPKRFAQIFAGLASGGQARQGQADGDAGGPHG